MSNPEFLDEWQSDVSDLLQRIRTDGSPRTFGPIRLTLGPHPFERQVRLVYSDKPPLRLSEFEYVIMWALVAVSRPDAGESGIKSRRDINRLLTSIMRESKRNDGSAEIESAGSGDVARNRLPHWYDEKDANDPDNVVTRLIHRINEKLQEAFGDVITIGMQRGRGYYLKVLPGAAHVASV